MTTKTPYTQVRHFGSGPRRAIAIHCTLAHAGAWAGVADALKDRLSITAFDLPSHGRSADWQPGMDQHRMATDMGLALLTEPMDLIGHSYGATVAMRMATERPDLVRTLTMIEPVYFAPAYLDYPELSQDQSDDLRACFEAIKAGQFETAAKLFSEQWGNGQTWEDIPERARKYMAERIYFVPGGQDALHHDSTGILAERKLEGLEMPVLLIKGETAPDVIDKVHASIARRVQRPRLATIKGAGHMAPISHPQDVAREISATLDEV